MNEVLQNAMVQAIGPFMTILMNLALTAMFALVTIMANAARKKLNLQIDDKMLQGIKLSITDIVKAINQTMVDDLKAAAKDGKLTEAERSAILQKAKGEFLTTLSENNKNYIIKKYGSLDAALEVLIHAAIVDIKNSSTGKKTAEAGASESLLLVDKTVCSENDSEASFSGEVSECLGDQSDITLN